TVIRLLDVWWKALGARLQAQALKVSIPEAPEEVASAASQLWQVALAQAQELTAREQEVARAALEEARTALDTERQVLQERVEASERLAAEADQRRDAAEVRLGDLQRLLDQQALQLRTLQVQSEESGTEVLTLRSKLEAAVEALADSQARAATDRAALEAAHRAAEDRWLQEVDRARQESDRLASGLRKLEREHAMAEDDATFKLAEATRALQRAERDEAVLASRVITLEAEIERLHSQLQKAIQRRSVRPASNAAKGPRRKSKAAKQG
ncbi:MAG TPA: hypothetical protein VFY12_08815, partial [Arenimonas sp.]|nr:hypothetical protein [Arenimonas sp.]